MILTPDEFVQNWGEGRSRDGGQKWKRMRAVLARALRSSAIKMVTDGG
jgi:hypothetical protein